MDLNRASNVDEQYLKSQLRKIARDIVGVEQRINVIERVSQAPYRSVSGGSTVYYDQDGEVRQIVGAQPDGTYTITDVNGPPAPAPPSTPILETRTGSVIVTWDGKMDNGSTMWPADFDHVEVHLSTEENFIVGDDTEMATYNTRAGGSISLSLEPSTYYWVKLVQVNTSGIRSLESEELNFFIEDIPYGIKTYKQDSAPTGLTVDDFGAIWYDTDDGNRQRFWDGTTWVDVSDESIEEALAAAEDALTTAYSRVRFSYATTRPTGLTTDDRLLWMNPNKGYAAEYWDGHAWSPYFFGPEAVGFDARDIGGILTSVGINPPTNPREGDIWYNENENHRPEVWLGGQWVVVRDGTIEAASIQAAQAITDANAALTAAQAAQATADGSIRTYYQSNPPWANGTTQPSAALGDMWFDQDDGNAYRWNGSTWQLIEDSSIAAALAAAQNAQSTADGKINSYYSTAAPTLNGEGEPLSAADTGDLWFDTDDGNKTSYWTGTAWAALPTGRGGLATDVITSIDSAVKTYVVEYSVNASETVAPTTGWSTAQPTRTAGTFVWFRATVTRNDNTTSTTSPALMTGNTGAPGANAPAIALTATTQVLVSPPAGGATTPATSTVTGAAVNTTITAWDYSVDGATFSATVPAGVSRTGNVVTITGSTMTARTIAVRMGNGAGISDTLTVAKVLDGAAGSTGGTGAAGADAYTVLLTNEAQTFAGSTTAALADSTSSQVIAYKGAVVQTATIGTITGQVTGLTTAITNNGTTTAGFTVTVTTALTQQTGTLSVPVTVGGITFTKIFSWTVTRTGATGATGSQGIQGPAGPNGATLYTWLKYADTPTTGMSDLPTGKTYMGIAYNKSSATESSVYSDYEWSLIQGPQGNQGIQGPAGANGQPTYTWIKYGDSAAGAGLSDLPAGKTYIGIAYNKTTQTESSLASDYEWSLIQGPQGPAGANAATISLTATAQILTVPATGGATSPTTAVVTGTPVNTTITAWTYSVDGAAFSATVPTGVSRTGDVVTVTGGTVTARTIAIRAADANGVADTLTVAKVSDGATGGTGGTGPAGADAYTVLLTNEAHTFIGSTTAAVGGSTTTSVIAYKGGTQIAATVGTVTGQVTGLTTAIVNNGTTTAGVTVTVTSALTQQNGTLTIPLTVDGKSFTKTFAWSVTRAGVAGAAAPIVSLTATSQALIVPAGGGATTPATSTVTGAATNTTITVWEYSVDGAAFSATVPAGASRTGNVVTITGSTMTARTIAVRMADANGVADTLTVAKVADGATGATGGTGGTGPAGADAYTVILTNEATVFAGSTTAALAGSTSSQILAYKGAGAVAATIGTITGQVTGLTTAVTNNGTTSAGFTVTVTTALTATSGELSVPVTVDGITFTKKFSWTVSRAGAAGAAGTPAPVIYLTATAQALVAPAGGGATTPATSTVTGASVNTTITAWDYSVDGGAFSATVPTGVSRAGNVITVTGGTVTARTIAVRMSDAGGVADTVTVAKVSDGATGATGGTGGTGPAGADAYTVLLTNEAHTFAGTTTAAVGEVTTTSVIAYKGGTQIAATIGTITGQVTGLTTAIVNNGTTTAGVTVTVTSALTQQNGMLTIPLTVDGKSFTKTFAWSVSRAGAAGAAAPVVSLTTTSQALVAPATGGATTPATATVTGTATNTTITVWEYSVDGGAFSATVPLGASRTGNVVTITGATMTARTITVRMADANGVADTLTVAEISNGATGGTGGTGAAGADAYTVLLTNEATVFPGSTTAALAGSTTSQILAYKGTAPIAATIGTITGQVTGLTTAITNNGTTTAGFTVTVTTSLTATSGELTVPVTVDGITFTKKFTWTVSRAGAAGANGSPAPLVYLTGTAQALVSPPGGGTTTPATSTVTGASVNTTITVWDYSVDGAAFSTTVPAGVSRSGNVVTVTGSTMTARTITVRMLDAAGVSDTMTVAKILDGASGGTGSTGPAGADAYTVLLTNEANVFAGSTTAALAGSTTSQVIAYKGATQVAATIGTITGQVTGLTTALTNNGTTTAGFTVTVTTALTATSGELVVPVTVDGQSFTKRFSWTVGRAGATGATGSTGVSVTSITPYYAQVTTGAATPATPVIATPPAPWTSTEPVYTANTELYRVEKITFSDGSFSYTTVFKSSSYDAASAANAAALAAAGLAAGKGRVYYQTAAPAVPTVENLIPNPSAEATAAATTIFTNLATNPLPASATGFTAANGAVLAYEAGTASMRVTIPAGGVTDVGLNMIGMLGAVAVGTYTYSVEVEAVVASTVRISVQGAFGALDGPGVSFTAGEIKRINLTVAHTGVGSPNVYVLRSGSTNAMDIRVRKIMKTLTPVAPADYFDGSTRNGYFNDPDFTTAWTGTANASTSVLQGIPVSNSILPPGWTVLGENGVRTIRSSKWAKAGTYSMRVIPVTNNIDSFVNLSYSSAQDGKSFVMKASLHLEAPLTGTLDGRARRLLSYDVGTTQSTQAPNTAGNTEHTIAFTSGGTIRNIRLYHGGSMGAGDVWYDALFLAETTDQTVVPFSGATADDAVYTYRWTGTANASTSKRYTVTAQQDLWIDTDDGNKPYRWDGGAWVAVTDKVAIDAAAAAAAAQATADSKITTYAGATDPAVAARAGDMWLKPETANGVSVNVLYRRNDTDTAWVRVDDPAAQQAIADAAAAAQLADGKMKIYPQTAAPTGLTASDNGDLWIDTDDGNKTYRYLHGSTAGTNGAGGAGPWISILDTSLASIQYVDQQILTSASGKNKTTYSTGVPGTTANTAGDIWFQYNGSNQIIGQWRGTGGTSWTAVTLENSVIATLDAAKINTGFLDVANRINAGSIAIGKVANLQPALDAEASKGTDLVINGTGMMNNNTNFSAFTYDKTDAPNGAVGVFDTTAGSNNMVVLDQMIAVDPNKRFQFSFQAKQKGTTSTGYLYALAQPFDAYNLAIDPGHYMYIPNTATTLAVALNPGATTITLTSSANWYGSATKPAGTNVHFRRIIFWDYTDPGGKLWPQDTYSRNVTAVDLWADGGISGNVITLRAPYSGPAKAAGTKLSNATSGGSYMYLQTATNVIVPKAWTLYSGTITGQSSGGNGAAFASGWPPGVAACKLGFLPNRVDSNGNTDPNSKHSFAMVSYSDASAAFVAASEARTGAYNDITTLWGMPGNTTYIDGSDIYTGTVRARQLLLMDVNNYLSDPNFIDNSAQSWEFGAGAGVVVSSGPTVPGYLSLNAAAINTNLHTGDASFWATEPGTEYLVTGEYSGNASNTGTAVFYPALQVQGNTGTTLSWPQTPITVGTSTAWTAFELRVIMPTNAARFRWHGFFNSSVLNNKVFVRGIKIRRKNAGNLIVDGSIEAGKLGANSVIAANIVSGEVTAEALSSNAIDGKTITGAIIRTAAAGKRLELTTSGLIQLDASNNVILSIGDQNKFTGEVEATSIIIRDSLQLFGRSNLFATGSKVTLKASAGNPSQSPTLSWEYETGPNINNGPYWYTSSVHTENGLFHSATYVFLNFGMYKKADGAYWQFPDVTINGSDVRSEFKPWSMTRIAKLDNGAERVVMVGEDCLHIASNGYPEIWIRVYDDSTMNTSGTGAPTLKATWKVADFSWFEQFRLGRHINGTADRNKFAYATLFTPPDGSNRTIKWDHYGWNNSDTGATVYSNNNYGAVIADGQNLGGVTIGARSALGIDNGTTGSATDFMAIFGLSTTNVVYNHSAAVWEPDAYWPTTFNTADRFWADGNVGAGTMTNFWAYNWGANTAQASKYANNRKRTTTNIWASYAWVGEASSGFKTIASPITSIPYRSGAQLRVTMPALPAPIAGVGAARDPAKDIYGWQYYVAYGSTAPTNLYLGPTNPTLVPNTALAVSNAILGTFPTNTGAIPLAASTFPASSPATIESDNGLLAITGDGKVTADELLGNAVNRLLDLFLPPGTMITSADDVAPYRTLICDGAAVSRTTYAVLFSKIGTTYGSGDGSTTFNVPRMQARSPIGAGGTADTGSGGNAYSLGQKFGDERLATHSHGGVTGNENQYHVHNQNVGANSGGPGFRSDYTGDVSAIAYPQGITTDTQSAFHTHNFTTNDHNNAKQTVNSGNVHPVLAVNFYIRY